MFELDDPNTIYNLITEKYGKHYHSNKTTMLSRKGSNRFRREPWMTAELLAEMRKRDRLAKVKERRSEYKQLRNSIVTRVRKAQKDHVDNQIKESVGNIKKHWNVIKQVTGKANKEEATTELFL